MMKNTFFNVIKPDVIKSIAPTDNKYGVSKKNIDLYDFYNESHSIRTYSDDD